MNEHEVVSTAEPLAAEPEAIVRNPAMTDGEKRRLLEELKLDLVERQTAAAENMNATDRDSKVSDLLRRVNDALSDLR